MVQLCLWGQGEEQPILLDGRLDKSELRERESDAVIFVCQQALRYHHHPRSLPVCMLTLLSSLKLIFSHSPNPTSLPLALLTTIHLLSNSSPFAPILALLSETAPHDLIGQQRISWIRARLLSRGRCEGEGCRTPSMTSAFRKKASVKMIARMEMWMRSD